MSLLRLLTSGKCLVALRDTASSYRMRQSHLLPKFGSAKNPFLARPEPALPAAPEMDRADVRMSPAELEASQLKETRRLPVAAPQPRTERIPGLPARWLDAIGARLRSLIPARWGSNRRAVFKPATAGSSLAPVQAEFPLDRIKVVRNDLSEADLEVIPAAAAASGRAALRAASGKRPVATGHDRAGAALASTQPN